MGVYIHAGNLYQCLRQVYKCLQIYFLKSVRSIMILCRVLVLHVADLHFDFVLSRTTLKIFRVFLYSRQVRLFSCVVQNFVCQIFKLYPDLFVFLKTKNEAQPANCQRKIICFHLLFLVSEFIFSIRPWYVWFEEVHLLQGGQVSLAKNSKKLPFWRFFDDFFLPLKT